MNMVKAQVRWVRMAPRKLRVVANAIRDKRADEALTVLSFIPKRAVKPVRKALNTALHIAKQKGLGDAGELWIREIYVDQGPMWKRWLPRARGRATRIRKFTSHITVVLGEKRQAKVD